MSDINLRTTEEFRNGASDVEHNNSDSRGLYEDSEKFCLSNMPTGRTSVEHWNAYHFGTILSKLKHSRSKSAMILLFLFFTSVMLLTCFAYFHLKSELDATKKNLYGLHAGVESLQKVYAASSNSKTTSLKANPKTLMSVQSSPAKAPFVAINLIGRNNQLQSTVVGQAITDWETTLQVGDISTFHDYIAIKVSGYYYVYTQMFFSDNESFYKGTLHFLIRKNRRKSLVVASVPKSACKSACTRYISRVVKLNKGDDLAITSYDSGIKFNMSRDKTQFGAYLLKIAE